MAEKLIENFQCSFSPPSLNHPLYCSPKLKRPEKNPLDLNNLPDDYTRDGKQVFEEGSSGIYLLL
ncbi:zinc finger protein JAGGED-like [Gossypium australe]|uniref:Zinc finger protein JAGGED-like n=1 Tax=Gossypium australe TaxID=47621 RepID=A0A5B6WNI2_9ROSI|nr:zinc finger protein JAGGED-like [Gossypium australe]